MMKYVPAVLGALAVVVASSGVATAEGTTEGWRTSKTPRAIVELFTSQGCSSCVEADSYFEELAKREDVVALSLHVDYWDYLGWRDTLADPANTDRQRDYAAVHGSRRIYTPQVIINGEKDYVGSDRRSIDAAIARSSLSVPVTMQHGEGTIEIEVAARAEHYRLPATIRLVLLTSEVEVAIARGENAGSTLDYYNVVRSMRAIGMWNGDAVKITLPVSEIMPNGTNGCAVIVQEDRPDGPGAIIGAAWLGNW